jgi:hypothetical protein
MEVLTQNFQGGTEVNHIRTLNSIDCSQVKIQTGHSPNTNQKRYSVRRLGLSCVYVHVMKLRHRSKLTFSSRSQMQLGYLYYSHYNNYFSYFAS